MPPYEEAAPPVASTTAQLYDPERNAAAFRELKQPLEETGADRLVKDGYDSSKAKTNDHRSPRFEDPRQLSYGALQTEQQFGFEFAKTKYLAAISAADRINQKFVYQDRCGVCSSMQSIDLALSRKADGCSGNSRMSAINPAGEANLRAQRSQLLLKEDSLWSSYLSPGTTRVQAGLRFIANGKREEGEQLVARGLQLRPEIWQDPKFQRMLEQARAQSRLVGAPRTPAGPLPRVDANDFYNYSGSELPPAPGAQFNPKAPLDRSTALPRIPVVDRAQTGWAPPGVDKGPAVGVIPPPVPQPELNRPGAPANEVRRSAGSEADKAFPYSKEELARREKLTMEYVAKVAPGYRFNPPTSAFRFSGTPVRQFPPLEPAPVKPQLPPITEQQPDAGKKDVVDPFKKPEKPVVGGKSFIQTAKEYANEDWVKGLLALMAAAGAIKGFQIYRRLSEDVVKQHVENKEQTKVTVDKDKPANERGVKAYDRVSGEELTKRSADGKHWEVTRDGGAVEKIAVQNIDRVRYEIVAENEREVKQLKAQLELDLKGMHERAGWVPKLDVQHDATITEKQKFVLTEKGVEVGRIQSINADGTIKVALADGTTANKTVGADTGLVLKVKDAVAAQQKLAGADINEFLKLASPDVTLRDWTRLQGEVREGLTKQFADNLQKALDESRQAHEQTKVKLEDAKKQLADQDKLNDTERKKFAAEIDVLQKQLEKATEAVARAEERLKTESAQRETAVTQHQETKQKLEVAQKELAALTETDTAKKAALEKQIKQLNADLTRNSETLNDVNEKLVKQIDETRKAREQAGQLEKSLDAVQAKLQTEQVRAQQLEANLQQRDAELKALAEAKLASDAVALEAEKQRTAREAQLVQAKAELDAAKKDLAGKTGTDTALKDATDKLNVLNEKYEASVKSLAEAQQILLTEQKARLTISEQLLKAQEALTKAQSDASQLKTKTETEQKALEKSAAELQKTVAELTTKLQDSDKRAATQETEQKRVSSELEKAQTELKDAAAKMSSDATKLADLRKQLSDREAELKLAQEAQRIADERAAAAEKQRTTLNTDLAKIRTELDAAKLEIDKKLGTEAALADANAKLSALETKYTDAVRARDEFQKQLAAEETERAKQNKTVDGLQEQLRKAQADLKDIGSKTADEKTALETTAKDLQKQLADATTQLQQAEERVSKSTKEQERIGQELQEARKSLVEATAKVTGDAATITALQRQLDAVKEAERAARLRAEEAEKQRTTGDAELEKVRAELEAAKRDLGKMTGTDAALKDATAKLAKLQTEFEEATKARDTFAEKLQTEQRERTKAADLVGQLNEQLTKTQAALADLGAKTADQKLALETETKALKTQLQDATTKLQQSEKRVADAQKEQQRAGTELQQARAALSEATAKISGDALKIADLQKQLADLGKVADANEKARSEADARAKAEEAQRKSISDKVETLEKTLAETRTKLEQTTAGKDAEVAAVRTQLADLQKQYDLAKTQLTEATAKAALETAAREAATKQAIEANAAITDLKAQLAAAEKSASAEKSAEPTQAAAEAKAAQAEQARLQAELTKAQAQVQAAAEALKASDARLETQTRTTTELQTRLTRAETALTEAVSKLTDTAAAVKPAGPLVTGKPITSGGENYRPIARDGDKVILLNIDKVGDGKTQTRTQAELSSLYERQILNIDGQPREFMVEKPKADGKRPSRVYQLVTEAVEGKPGTVKLVGEIYIKNLSDKAGNSGQTYAQWLEHYDQKKGTVEVEERLRPGIQRDVPPSTATAGGAKDAILGEHSFKELPKRLQEKLPTEFNQDVSDALERTLEAKRKDWTPEVAAEYRKLADAYARGEAEAVKKVHEILTNAPRPAAEKAGAVPVAAADATSDIDRKQHSPELQEGDARRQQLAVDTFTSVDGIRFLSAIPIAEMTAAKVQEKLEGIDKEIQRAREAGLHDYAEELKRMKTEYDGKKTQGEKETYAREVVERMKEAHETASHAGKPGKGPGIGSKAGTTVAVLLIAGWLMDVTAPKAVASPSGPRVLPGKR